ncbi:hypothetical protein Misp01_75260 [Microtetraspora sp. NBRC 13810]|uniref:nitrate- and nitrite sensing domain-containing protein n=1 Tax=Microtetraspora sp. NBRC 13810 TaxID=3030990 RepID=UPI0024A02D65|nr:nitrate- and nitrite sensing domain-containing protein [Microtetraspora sp. NBRC 13810]GLW12398.1 hypothetical protein Misp01_75260 [Microtetraspora sp. NBRC 13810]
MRFRKSRVGTKVTALLLSLVALWVFAAWVTLREGVNLLWVSRLDVGVAQPSQTLVIEIQHERRLSVVALAANGPNARAALAAQRARTDALRAEFEEQSQGAYVQLAASPVLEARLTATYRLLDGLSSTRKSVDDGEASQEKVTAEYNRVVDSFFQVFDSLATLDDDDFANDTRALLDVYDARELLAQEDTFLAGVLARGRFTGEQHTRFIELVGVQRYVTDQSLDGLRLADPASYQNLQQSGVLRRVRELEDTMVRFGGPDAAPPIDSGQWRAATEPALKSIDQAVVTAGDRLVERATPIATAVVVRLVLAGGLGLLAVVASIVLSITTARDLVRQLEKLRGAATELANERLPDVVNRLGHGERVDVAAEAPPLEFGDDQIGQVGQAFNHVQETAIRVAVEQAELRRSIREILLSLARRTQSLVHRQLTLLDAMERRESDPKDLKDLFRVDHLATRMRRNAENLIVLSGASPARSWRRPVPMIDVVRGALAEVEDYTRVNVPPMGEVALAGRAVGDVIHLLAELIENAVSYSPPYTTAQVVGQMATNGYVIEIEDRGLGMSPADLATANDRIVNPPEFDLRDTTRLGLYVVSRLAERHGIRVTLKPSPYGGTTAVILIPMDIVAEDDGAEPGAGSSITADERRDLGRDTDFDAPPAVRDALDPRDPDLRRPEVREIPARPEPSRTSALAAIPRSRPDRDSLAERGKGPETQEEPPPVQETAFTPHGLPFRVPQANLVEQLRSDVPDPGKEEPAEDDRSPEEIRRIMGSYQAGTLRGRTAAQEALNTGPVNGVPRPVDGEHDPAG